MKFHKKAEKASTKKEADSQSIDGVAIAINSNGTIRRELDISTTPNNKKFACETNEKRKFFFCCSLCDLLGIDIKKSGYEIVNVVDEDSIYSPQHETKENNKDLGKGR